VLGANPCTICSTCLCITTMLHLYFVPWKSGPKPVMRVRSTLCCQLSYLILEVHSLGHSRLAPFMSRCIGSTAWTDLMCTSPIMSLHHRQWVSLCLVSPLQRGQVCLLHRFAAHRLSPLEGQSPWQGRWRGCRLSCRTAVLHCSRS